MAATVPHENQERWNYTTERERKGAGAGEVEMIGGEVEEDGWILWMVLGDV